MARDHFIKQLWISFGIILASVVIAGGVLALLSNNIFATASAIVNDRASVQNKTDALADLASLEAQVPQAAQYQAAMNQLLPDQYGLVTFTQWLSQLGAKYSVTTDAAFQGAITPPAGAVAGTAQFSFSADGAPQNVADFLDEMNTKSSGFLVSLNSFDVMNATSGEEVTGQGLLFFR